MNPRQELEVVDALKSIAALLSQINLLLSDLLIITSRVTFTEGELGVLADIYHHYGDEPVLEDPAQFRDAILALGGSLDSGSDYYRSAAFKVHGLPNTEFEFLLEFLKKSPPPAA
jgi:hypothetical protein